MSNRFFVDFQVLTEIKIREAGIVIFETDRGAKTANILEDSTGGGLHSIPTLPRAQAGLNIHEGPGRWEE